MKSITVCCILIAGLCLCACLPVSAAGGDATVPLSSFMITLDPPAAAAGSGAAIAAANDNYPISVEQAKKSIRAFTGNQDLDPVLSSTGSMSVGSYYQFSGDTPSSYYYVNQNSGLVEFAQMTENMPSTGTFSLSRDEAYAKGTEFARAHFENFDAKTWKIATEQQLNISWYRMNGTEYEPLTVPTYLFALREEQDHIMMTDTVTVLVSAVDGKVIIYGGIDRLLQVDLKPTVTMSQAIQVAEKHFGGTVIHSSAMLSVVTRPMNVQSLAWEVTLQGYYDDYTYSQNFAIDAMSGDYLTDRIWPDAYTYFLYNGY
jgi:hypothetical protein